MWNLLRIFFHLQKIFFLNIFKGMEHVFFFFGSVAEGFKFCADLFSEGIVLIITCTSVADVA